MARNISSFWLNVRFITCYRYLIYIYGTVSHHILPHKSQYFESYQGYNRSRLEGFNVDQDQ